MRNFPWCKCERYTLKLSYTRNHSLALKVSSVGKWKKFCCDSTMSGSEVFFGFEFGLKAKIQRNKMERKTKRESFAKTWTGKRRWE